MTFLRFSAVVGGLLSVATLALPAAAEDSLATPNFKTSPAKPKAKAAAATPKSDRRPGELEGWDSGLKGPVKVKAKAPADVIGEHRLPDGGLPLPEQRGSTPGMGDAPIGIDKNGNVGGMFKF